jgi:hypothetical protein
MRTSSVRAFRSTVNFSKYQTPRSYPEFHPMFAGSPQCDVERAHVRAHVHRELVFDFTADLVLREAGATVLAREPERQHHALVRVQQGAYCPTEEDLVGCGRIVDWAKLLVPPLDAGVTAPPRASCHEGRRSGAVAPHSKLDPTRDIAKILRAVLPRLLMTALVPVEKPRGGNVPHELRSTSTRHVERCVSSDVRADGW